MRIMMLASHEAGPYTPITFSDEGEQGIQITVYTGGSNVTYLVDKLEFAKCITACQNFFMEEEQNE
jgi:hypothetical protein